MLLLAALAASAMAQPPAYRPRPELVRHATATVRIVSGERVRFGRGGRKGRATQVHERLVREKDGRLTPITLVEFP